MTDTGGVDRTGATATTAVNATAPRPPLPSGTVTFIFTDIEGSTRMLAALGGAYEDVLEEHRRRIRAAVAAAGGREVSTEGDALFLAFASPSAAVAAAVDSQRSLAEQVWPGGTGIPVRMGIHTGEVTLSGADYVGLEVHRAARIGAAAHGGQVLLSSATRSLVEERLPAGVSLKDLGEHRLRDLSRAERLTQLIVDGLRNDFPPPRTLDATPNNLPVQITSFVGRDGQVAEAERLLERTRLLTLTGPGGTGKTRLALQVAADVVDRFPDGVHFVPLAPISDPVYVLPAIAQSIGVDTGGRRPLEALGAAIAKQRRLLVLDNFEQVLGAASDVAQLLRMTEQLKVIVTSRAVLRISGEQELPVPPLDLPDPRQFQDAASLSQYEAVRLFIERGVAARPDFAVTNENAPAVAEITSRLDGLPLAIELAAARLRLLPPQSILARLGDRLALLSGGARDLPARQQTLRAAIAWSYDLLEPAERELFERAGVFMGGWTFEAADAICDPDRDLGVDSLDGLSSLSDKSLVKPQEDPHGDARFLMLETIRDFAVERLNARPDVEAIRDRHGAWFLAFAESSGKSLGGPERSRRLFLLEDDHDNLRAALTWYMARDRLVDAGRMVTSLWRFWQQRGHLLEARTRADALIAADDRLHVLDASQRFAALTAAGGISYWQGDIATVHARYREALEIARRDGSRAELAEALYNFSFAPVAEVEAEDWFGVIAATSPAIVLEAEEIFQELGDKEGEARASWALGDLFLYGSKYPEAKAALDKALALFRALGDAFGEAWTYHSMAIVQFHIGEPRQAAQNVGRALDLFMAGSDISGAILSLLDLAGVAAGVGDRPTALRLAGVGEALVAKTSTGLGSTQFGTDVLIPVPRRPDSPNEQQLWTEGAAMSFDGAIAYAHETIERLNAELDPAPVATRSAPTPSGAVAKGAAE